MPGPAQPPQPAGLGDEPVPSAGPYYVASSADDRVVLLPNPSYGGTRHRRWARIVYTEDVPTPQAVALAERGAVGYAADFDPGSLLGPAARSTAATHPATCSTVGTFLD